MNKVLIIEDNPDIRLALRTYISSNPELKVIGDYENCEEALLEIKNKKPQIILMDIGLSGMNGIQGTFEAKKRSPKSEIIMVTVFEDSESVFSALKAGATGYLTKTFTKPELLDAINQAIAGGAPMSSNIAKIVVSSFNKNIDSPLTARETQIIQCLSEGKSYNSTANSLCISTDTVKYHIKNIYLKLHVTSKEEAISIAYQEKYI